MVVFDQEKCVGCALCAGDCVRENIIVKNGKAYAKRTCIQCGHCVAVCPCGAVSIPDYDMEDVEEFSAERFGLDIARLLYTIKARRSIRRYEERPVERAKLQKLVQAGRYTATGINTQGCRFVVVQDGVRELKKIIWSGVESAIARPGMAPEDMRFIWKTLADKRERNIDYLFRDAPVVIYVAADREQDACLAAQNMELAAVSQGLGVMYNGYLRRATAMNPDALRFLDLQDKTIAICMLLGYPGIRYKRTAPRREADVRWR